ncbi:zinc finger and BTB domain-containing protein 18 [Scaptodrosophila lebanonensis]|uniref:Zinc finger and BTB domain-containing protein 18 n=1 Tax=Drosophila lebanonensis TaxID=7225 RepID=A0A6J2T524_DROLE|nr:zinc finger and BTB domain-containing protein 18 [Scaptodrosophila lebanonensis]
MTGNDYPDIDTLCRLCLKKYNKAFPIFNDDNSQLSIPMRIITCLSVEAKITDGMPQKICADCRYNLEMCYLFRQRSQMSDKKLRKHIRLLGLGKKSRVFDKSVEDYDEDELEFEDSEAFLKAQREVRRDEWQDKYKLKTEEDFKKRLDALKVDMRVEITELVRQELREEVRADVHRELLDKMQEEVRKVQIAKLVGELEIFLNEKKAGSWELVDEIPTESKEPTVPVPHMVEIAPPTKTESVTETETHSLARKRNRRCTAIPKTVQRKSRVKKDMLENSDLEFLPENEAEPEHVEDVAPNVLDGVPEKENNVRIFGSDGEIYIIKSTVEDKTPESTKEYHLEPTNKSITSYNIKDNGDIQFSSDKDAEVQNVVVLNLDADISDDLQLSDLEDNVYILPDMKVDSATVHELPAKRTRRDFVVKQNSKQIAAEPVNKAGRTTDTIKSFQCQMCPTEFATEKSWLRHLNIHVKNAKGGRGYKCSVCGLQVSCGSSLKRHLLIHTGVKPHKCKECGQSFVQREVLKRHMDTHTGEKRHQCPHCSIRFAQKTNLRQHIQKLHLKKPNMHKCHLCPSSFSHASGLSRHLSTHAGVMFACKECGREFSDHSSVSRHVQNVHNIKNKVIDGYVSEAETASSK